MNVRMHPFTHALLDAGATVLYVTGIATFLSHAQEFFPLEPSVFIPIVMLLLFILSAVTTGFLVVGRPVLWYLDGRKREARALFGATLAFLLVSIVVVLMVATRAAV